jgi:ankyrin repeat protein
MKPATTSTKSHIVQIAASTPLLCLLGLVALLVGCGSSPESARKNLAKLGKDFTPATFTECVGNGDKEAVRLFLAAGMDVNTPGDGGITALAAAAMKGNTELVRTL